MGTCAPSYANLYLGEWERMLLSSVELAVYMDHIILWYRYIDVFAVWDDSLALLNEFLNVNYFNLKFTMLAFTFKRAKSITDNVVQSELRGEGRGDQCKYPGMFTCSYCRYINTKTLIILANGEKCIPKHYANCKTKGGACISSHVNVPVFIWTKPN